MDLPDIVRLVAAFTQAVGKIPWEQFSNKGVPSLREIAQENGLPGPHGEISATAAAPRAPALVPTGSPPGAPRETPARMTKPGCTAADESIVVAGHLRGLAEGWGGFGVLRADTERLERAAAGAAAMGDTETAAQLRSFIPSLSTVHTPEEARGALARMEPLLPTTWNLGKRCGGVSAALKAKAEALAAKVNRSEITQAQAAEELRQEVLAQT